MGPDLARAARLKLLPCPADDGFARLDAGQCCHLPPRSPRLRRGYGRELVFGARDAERVALRELGFRACVAALGHLPRAPHRQCGRTWAVGYNEYEAVDGARRRVRSAYCYTDALAILANLRGGCGRVEGCGAVAATWLVPGLAQLWSGCRPLSSDVTSIVLHTLCERRGPSAGDTKLGWRGDIGS